MKKFISLFLALALVFTSFATLGIEVQAKDKILTEDDLDIIWVDKKYVIHNWYEQTGVKDGLIIVRIADIGSPYYGKPLVINTNGDQIISLKYDYIIMEYGVIDALSNGDGPYGSFDYKGNSIDDEKAEQIRRDYIAKHGEYEEGVGENDNSISPSIFEFTENDKVGFKDEDGQVIISPKYDECIGIRGDTALVRNKIENPNQTQENMENDYEYALINKDGQELIPFRKYWSMDGNRREPLIKVEVNHVLSPFTYGFINWQGEVVVEPNNFWAKAMKDGLAIIPTGNSEENWHNWNISYINEKGESVLDVGPYSQIDHFYEGLATAGKFVDDENEVYMYINKEGKEVIGLKDCRLIGDFHNNYAVVQRKSDEVYGLLRNPFVEKKPDNTDTNAEDATNVTTGPSTEVDTNDSDSGSSSSSSNTSSGGDISPANTSSDKNKEVKEEKKEEIKKEEKASEEAKSFSDVSSDDWFYKSINFVSKNAYMNGISSTDFAPDLFTSRAMMWQIFYNMLDRPEVDADILNPYEWYAKAQAWAKATKLSDGSNPNHDITREQVVLMLYRHEGSPAVTGSSSLAEFTDSEEISSWALDAMIWAVENGVINGKGDGILDPMGKAARAEIATLIMNYSNK